MNKPQPIPGFRLHKNNTVTKRLNSNSLIKLSFRLHKNNTVTKRLNAHEATD